MRTTLVLHEDSTGTGAAGAASRPAVKRTIAPNVIDDGRRLIATAKIGRDRRRRRRFPRTTPLRTITDWITDTCAALRKEKRSSTRLKGTLAGEIAKYGLTLPRGRTRTDTLSNLRPWALVLGEIGRRSITAERLAQVTKTWIEAGVAASTLKHRRRALAQFLERQHDHELGAIVRGLKMPAEPKTPPRGAEIEILHAIIAGMDEHRSGEHPGRGGRGFRNKARARLLLWLWTGAEPATQARIAATDIDLARNTITLPPRNKGRGVDAITLPLLGRGPEAARAWLRAFAWGPCTTRALGRAFHRAVRLYVARERAAGRTVTLPTDLTPKHLRHSFLSWIVTHCELDIAQQYAQHLNLSTTQRYTQRVVAQRIAAAAKQINAAHQQSTGAAA